MTTIRVRRGIALLSTALLAATALVAGAAAPARAAAGCEVNYRESATWNTGFVGEARIKNLGDTWNGYLVQFTFSGNQRVNQVWNHSIRQDGHEVEIRSTPWAPPVGTNETLLLGFAASYSGTNTMPTNWRVNGVRCSMFGDTPTVIAEPAAVTVPEGGGGHFTVRLSHPPSGTVMLGMAMRGTGLWASPPVMLVFTPTNWSIPQSYAIMSMQDADAVNDVLQITLTVPGHQPDAVTLTQLDDD